MEKKQKIKLAGGIFLAAALVLVIFFALLAPHGEDYNRDSASRVLEGNRYKDPGGLFLTAKDAASLIIYFSIAVRFFNIG